MRSRAAAIQGLLALAGLVAAYLTWQREPSPDEGSTVVLDITKRQLQKLRYEDGASSSWVELEPGKDDNGDLIWVRFSGKKGSHMALPSGHPTVDQDVPERQVRGNASAEKLWSLFAPLTGSRALGVLDEKTRKDLGIDASKKKIHVTWAGMTKTFTLAPSPPGATEPYMKNDEDNKVFVVNRQILTDFQAAQSNIVERRFHSFLIGEVDKVVIRAGAPGKPEKTFLYKRNDGRGGGDLVPAATPDKPDETADNWHDRIFGLFPADVLGRGETPAGGEPKVVVHIDYFYRDRKIGWMDLARSGDAAGQPAADPNGPPRTSTLARSEFTAGWMRLALDAQTLVNEGETLFGEAPSSENKPAK